MFYSNLEYDLYSQSFPIRQVVELDAAYRERVHKYQIHTYFYGHVIEPPYGISSKGYVQAGEQTPDQTMHLSPLSTSVNFGDITIYRIGEGESYCAFLSQVCKG